VKLFDQPNAPARAAIQAFTQRAPGAATNEASTLVAHILARVDELTASHASVPLTAGDALRADIARAVDLLCPLDPLVASDPEARRANAVTRTWVSDTFKLVTGHLDL
jgi:hypothetical protein